MNSRRPVNSDVGRLIAQKKFGSFRLTWELRGMSWKAKAHKIYEERVVKDSLIRLSEAFDLETLPFSGEELQTLAKRARESFRNPEKKTERLDRYKTYLSNSYGADLVSNISSKLEEINNKIGFEEK